MKKEIKILLSVFAFVILGSFIAYQTVLKENINPDTVKETPSFPLITNLVASHSFSYGPQEAKVTVVEFFDPECESCSAVAPQIKKEMKYYEGKVRWVFRYMPYHFNSKNAIAALEAARKQNLFLEAMNLLFLNQHKWGEKRISTKDEIIKIVTSLEGLNRAKFMKDLEDPSIEHIIMKDQTEGSQAGVKGTPTFFVNGVLLERLSLDDLISKINYGLAE